MRTISLEVFRNKSLKPGIPGRVLVELTHRCNFDCVHCYVRKGEGEMSEARVKTLIDSLAQAGTITLGFTGGEPLARKDIFRILAYAAGKGFRPMLYTNASLITPAAARRLKTLGVSRVAVSMHGANRDNFERVTRTKGSYAKTMRGLAALRKAGIPIAIKSCASVLNPGDIPALSALAKTLDAELRLTPALLPKGGKKNACSATCGHTGDGKQFPACGAGRTQCLVTPTGRIRPCPALSAPSVKAGKDFAAAFRRLAAKLKGRKG